MKKRIVDFKSGITKVEMGNLLGGTDPTCGATTPSTLEETNWHRRLDSGPDTYCDDDDSQQ